LDYRERLLEWMHHQRMAGQRVTLRTIARQSDVSWSVVQRLTSGKMKAPPAETLRKIGIGIGQGPDFFFREETPGAEVEPGPQGKPPHPCVFEDPTRMANAYALAVREAGFECLTFEVVCRCAVDHELYVAAFKDGILTYCGSERRRGEGKKS
jgi:hypothetical protein